MSIELRKAVASDLEAVAVCDDRVFGWSASGRHPRDLGPNGELVRQIRDGGMFVLVDDGWIAGFVACEQHFKLLYVATLAVLPDYQGRGLGRRLVAAAEREATRRNLEGVSLFADGKKLSTLEFYRSCGFEETSRCLEHDFQRVFFNKPIAA